MQNSLFAENTNKEKEKNMRETNSSADCFRHTIDAPKSDSFHRHMHNGYEILYFVRGNAEYIIESSVYRLRPHDLLLIHPRCFHCLRPLSDATYERFCINFDENRIPPTLVEFMKTAPNIRAVAHGSLAERFFDTWAEAEKTLDEEEMKLFLQPQLPVLLLFLAHLPQDAELHPSRGFGALEEILRFIDENPTIDITAKALAERFYISVSTLVHRFKNDLGISLMQYIDKKRILYAQSLLLGGKSPTEVAELCNYENYSTFYRQYRKILGASPRDDYMRK